MIRSLFIFTLLLPFFIDANEKASTCVSIQNDKSRLSCFDFFFKPKVLESDEANEIKTSKNSLIDRSKIEQDDQRLKDDGLVKKVIAAVRISSLGKFQIILTNGQEWESQFKLPKFRTSHFKSGNEIKINKNKVGDTFFIDLITGNKIQVNRVK
tara:strand:- start:506 stop:967 length:462 start_codon:yes stop_codon:yes gene_type:complete